MSLAVFGGNGFLGKRIAQKAIESGVKVIAFSRSGKPPAINNHHDAYWISKVEWKKADILNPATYSKEIRQVDTVVHSIGMLFEDQAYKLQLSGEINLWEDLKKIGAMAKGPNPMEKAEIPPDQTYEAVQRDSAILLADTLLKTHLSKKKQPNTPTFVYISADKLMPGIPLGYIETKREAEYELMNKEDLRTIVLRPGFMYDALITNPKEKRNVAKSVIQCGYSAKQFIFGDKIDFLNSSIRPPVSTQQVATVAWEKIQDKLFSGIVPLEVIAKA